MFQNSKKAQNKSKKRGQKWIKKEGFKKDFSKKTNNNFDKKNWNKTGGKLGKKIEKKENFLHDKKYFKTEENLEKSEQKQEKKTQILFKRSLRGQKIRPEKKWGQKENLKTVEYKNREKAEKNGGNGKTEENIFMDKEAEKYHQRMILTTEKFPRKIGKKL